MVPRVGAAEPVVLERGSGGGPPGQSHFGTMTAPGLVAEALRAFFAET